jgi:hypothetical protein
VQARSSSQRRRCSGPYPHPRRPRCETCATRRRHSSSRRSCSRLKAQHPAYTSKAVRGMTAAPKAKRHSFTQVARRGNQPTRAERQPGSGSLTRVGRPRMATPATSSTLTEWVTRRHGRRWATTLSGAAATTAVRIAPRHRNPRGPVCSDGRSARRVFPSTSAIPPQSISTRGETDPRVWLNDYRLACQLGGATTDEVIIPNLLLYLADSARTWLNNLPPSQIHN